MNTSRGGHRPLTHGEVALVRSVFKDAIDCSTVRIYRRKWFPLQPANVVMAPTGHIHFHPESNIWCEDFSSEDLDIQGLFIHEMTHIWQFQKGVFLPLRRPWLFCRYDYSLREGWPLERYGIEQQAEIVRHAFLLKAGVCPVGVQADARVYEGLLPF